LVTSKKSQDNEKRKPISVASRKQKGRKLQQWVAEQISKLLNIPWGKDCLIASREMGQNGTDIRLIGDALKKFPFSVETKAQETWSMSNFIEQAKANQMENTDWLLFLKKNKNKPIVVMDAIRFFNLLERIKNGKNN